MILEFHVFPFEQLSCIAYHATKAKKKEIVLAHHTSIHLKIG
jgi:hypothetical protein